MAKISARGATKVAEAVFPHSDYRVIYVLCSDGRILHSVAIESNNYRRGPYTVIAKGSPQGDLVAKFLRFLAKRGVYECSLASGQIVAADTSGELAEV